VSSALAVADRLPLEVGNRSCEAVGDDDSGGARDATGFSA
jgi:hypothetical protein